MKFHWRLHSALLRGREDDFLNHIKSQGDTVQFVSGRVSSIDAPDPKTNDIPGIALTTIEDAQHLLSKGLWRSPHFLYFNPLKYNVSYWLPRINPLIPTLNQHCEFVPAGLISRLKSKVPEGGVFIRPDSGLKLFTGQVFCPNHNYGWHSIQHDVFEVARIPRETILCISNSRVLEPIEWRFWIVNAEVAAYASYSWNDAIDSSVLPPVPDAALTIAEQMAGNPWQPDVTFVVDVVQDAMDGQFYLNELNATSTSGVYNVSAPSLLNALKNVAEKELDGDVSIIDD